MTSTAVTVEFFPTHKISLETQPPLLCSLWQSDILRTVLFSPTPPLAPDPNPNSNV